MITRLAPTPSGYLHQGNVFNFLLNWLWARSNGGKVLLRIDDGDSARKRKEYVEDIFRVLEWIGLDWDTGPSGPGDFEQHWSQLHRKELYQNQLHQLTEKNMLFACTCSRHQQCNCVEKDLPYSTAGAALKIKVPVGTSIDFCDIAAGNVFMHIAPFVVWKKDGFAAYQLCSLADDRHFGITHICRGNDLEESTAMQLYFDQYIPGSYFHNVVFWHHRLLTSAQGEKFSKSAGTLGRSICTLVKREALLAAFVQWAGISLPGNITLQEMMESRVFSVKK